MLNSTCCHVGAPQHRKAAFSLWHWSQRCHFMEWRWNFLCPSHSLWSLPVYSIHKPKIEMKKDVLPQQQKVKKERIGSKINHFWIWKEINPWGSTVFLAELFYEPIDWKSTVLQISTLTTAAAFPTEPLEALNSPFSTPWKCRGRVHGMGWMTHRWWDAAAKAGDSSGNVILHREGRKCCCQWGQFDWSDARLLNKHPLGCPSSAWTSLEQTDSHWTLLSCNAMDASAHQLHITMVLQQHWEFF